MKHGNTASNVEPVKVSVVIVAYNSGLLLLDCLRAALESTVSVEVVVSDNGSTDPSIDAIAEMGGGDSRIHLLRNGANIGFAAACNRGVTCATGDWVLLLNPDCLLSPDCIERLVSALAANPAAGMAGGLVRNPDGSEQAGCRRNLPTLARMSFAALGRGLGKDAYLQAGSHLPSDPIPIPAISGALMMIRRSAWETIGPMDEGYFLHWEDLDYCARAQAAKIGILFVPAATAVHFKGRSSASAPLRVEWFKHVGMVKYFRKFELTGWKRILLYPLAAALGVRFSWRAVTGLSKKVLRMFSARSPDTGLVAPTILSGGRPEIWVLGATSIVGRHLLPRLVAAGFQIRAFSRRPPSEDGCPSISWHRVDLTSNGLPGVPGKPEAVISLVPLPLLPPVLHTLARGGPVRLLAFGTTSRFTKENSTNPAERAMAKAMAQAEAELAESCTSQGLRWAVFRPTLVYSPGYDKNISLLLRFIQKTRCFLMPGTGRGLRQPVHADDLAKACLQILNSPAAWNAFYDLSGGETLSYREMVLRLFGFSGLAPRMIRLPIAVWRAIIIFARQIPAYRHLDMAMINRADRDMVFDHSTATHGFGFQPRKFLSS